MQHFRGGLGSGLEMVSLISVLLKGVRLLSSQLHVLHELSEVLQRGVVRVSVGEGRIVSVDVERHRQQLRHDAVVSYQCRQTAVNFQKTLTSHHVISISVCLPHRLATKYKYLFLSALIKFHLYLISLVQPDNDVVCDAQRMESLGNPD